MILKVLTPGAIAFEGKVDSVIVPATDGLLGILKGHAPILASLKTGTLQYKVNNQKKEIEIANGFLEVKDDLISVLTDDATIN